MIIPDCKPENQAFHPGVYPQCCIKYCTTDLDINSVETYNPTSDGNFKK